MHVSFAWFSASYKWKHTLRIPLCLASLFSIIYLRFIHVLSCNCSSSISIVIWSFVVWLYHTIFLHSTVDKTAIKIATGLPWWRSGWESACQCRGHGFEPWSGKIPHVAERLGPWATIAEPARLEPVLRNKRGCDSERPVHRDEEWPPLATTGESPRTETKTQHSHK